MKSSCSMNHHACNSMKKNDTAAKNQKQMGSHLILSKKSAVHAVHIYFLSCRKPFYHVHAQTLEVSPKHIFFFNQNSSSPRRQLKAEYGTCLPGGQCRRVNTVHTNVTANGYPWLEAMRHLSKTKTTTHQIKYIPSCMIARNIA